jgi:hypothetical protein
MAESTSGTPDGGVTRKPQEEKHGRLNASYKQDVAEQLSPQNTQSFLETNLKSDNVKAATQRLEEIGKIREQNALSGLYDSRKESVLISPSQNIEPETAAQSEEQTASQEKVVSTVPAEILDKITNGTPLTAEESKTMVEIVANKIKSGGKLSVEEEQFRVNNGEAVEALLKQAKNEDASRSEVPPLAASEAPAPPVAPTPKPEKAPDAPAESEPKAEEKVDEKKHVEAKKPEKHEKHEKPEKHEKAKKVKVENKIDLELLKANSDYVKWMETVTLLHGKGILTDAQNHAATLSWLLKETRYYLKTNEMGGNNKYLYEGDGKYKKENRVKDKNGKDMKFARTGTPKLNEKGETNSRKQPSTLKFLMDKYNEKHPSKKAAPATPQPVPEAVQDSATTPQSDILEQQQKQKNLDYVRMELAKADRGEPNNTGIITPEVVNFLEDNNTSDNEIREMMPEERWSKVRELLKSKPEDSVKKPADTVVAAAEASETGEKTYPQTTEELRGQYDNYLTSLGYTDEKGKTAFDVHKLRDKEGNYVIDSTTSKPFEFKFYKEANEFLKKESEKGNNKPEDVVATIAENVADLGAAQEEEEKVILEAEAAVAAPENLPKAAVGLTQGAKDLLKKIDESGVNPGFVSSGLESILKENEIPQEDIDHRTPQELMEMLRSKSLTELLNTTVSSEQSKKAPETTAPEDKIKVAEEAYEDANKDFLEVSKAYNNALNEDESYKNANKNWEDARSKAPLITQGELDEFFKIREEAEKTFRETPLGKELFDKEMPFLTVLKEAEKALEQAKANPVSS